MNLLIKIITGFLGTGMLLPGLGKFTEPFNIFIYKQLELTGIPFPEVMQHVVKLSEVAIGLILIFIAFLGNKLSAAFRNKIFYLANSIIIVMMIVAIYVHLHPNVPAEILPLESKPPIMAVAYILLVVLNTYMYRKQSRQE